MGDYVILNLIIRFGEILIFFLIKQMFGVSVVTAGFDWLMQKLSKALIKFIDLCKYAQHADD